MVPLFQSLSLIDPFVLFFCVITECALCVFCGVTCQGHAKFILCFMDPAGSLFPNLKQNVYHMIIVM